MDEHSLKVLEFEQVRELLMPHAACELGLEKIRALAPTSELPDVQRLQRETAEARRVMQQHGTFPLGGVHDVRGSVRRAAIEGALDETQLFAIAETLGGIRRMKAFLGRIPNIAPALSDYAIMLGDFQKIEDRIFGCINDKGEVVDNASQRLSQIRVQIRTTHNRMIEKLNSILRTQKNLIQEPIITVRGDRYCIPVKSENRSHFGGLVHDQSASGATLFMEPTAVVELGNEIRQLAIKERQEIERILAELTAFVGAREAEIQASLEVMAIMDFTVAKARLAQEIDAVEPQINAAGILDIRYARHPLLSGHVVPIDVRLGGDFNTLVITGPNTGGKTVTLKTVGLLTLMAQCGLQVPCKEGSVLSTFVQVFADIGDEQSIQQSLSTFSSHIRQVVKIVQRSDHRTLVLLDEVGAGTDPTEGAALARAVLEHLTEAGARTIVSTHYGELKEFAYSREGVENASVEFDLATLRPTYRLMIGIPGASNALTIASRLGLPDTIVERAEGHLSSEHVELSTVIRRLEEDSRIAQDERQIAERTLGELRDMKERYEQELRSLRSARSQVLEQARMDSLAAVRAAKEQAEQIITELRRQEREGRETEHARANLRALADLANESAIPETPLPQALPDLGERAEEIIEAVEGETPPPVPGDEVLVTSLNQRGQLLGEPRSNGEAQVAIGALKVWVPFDTLKPVRKTAAKRAPAQVYMPLQMVNKRADISPELHLRGQRVDEALLELDKYLDDAYLAGMQSARIVHGKGTGTLRKFVWEHLKKHHSVKSYRLGDADEGAWGVTIVEFKEE